MSRTALDAFIEASGSQSFANVRGTTKLSQWREGDGYSVEEIRAAQEKWRRIRALPREDLIRAFLGLGPSVPLDDRHAPRP